MQISNEVLILRDLKLIKPVASFNEAVRCRRGPIATSCGSMVAVQLKAEYPNILVRQREM